MKAWRLFPLEGVPWQTKESNKYDNSHEGEGYPSI